MFYVFILADVPGPLLNVRVIPNTVLMLITWTLENNDESPINVTISYRVIDDRIPISDWNVLQVESSKVTIFQLKNTFSFNSMYHC